VTDSAFTVFEGAAVFGLAGAALGAGAVFDVLSFCAGGALCPAATKLLANIRHAIRLRPIFTPYGLYLLLLDACCAPLTPMRGDE
jgi:hypothetical protein